ncbi:HD domain-containing protein [Lentiprolixibacter aurantiacus]|uniref:HD domain-containing protein n=1 Tax=Lentiprolixibacter aurantiacus TaxID=2993939 RepID=A0AAE3SPH2_9FLAO|nr:HD domain-containing protein [Lentiprolixibacter aurantiacus]MCX2719537.1 HD domain-containing protein [Lentiprolixibacter aurantiacus]
MSVSSKLTIFNDPIYGFIRIPNPLVFRLVEHRYFQRLRHISQMGLSYLVFPGAHHTRFHHALGSMHLMQLAMQNLRLKGVSISREEEDALLAAILLHDIGHGPFSHAMERGIAEGLDHESLSLHFMNDLNKNFNGSLTLAIAIFKGTYSRKFMNQLVTSQLDMDRLDYLKRDSFYTGVAEGNINAERLIYMLHVAGEDLVVEEKGIYSVEKFLMARRFMYWQVYLHKTGIVAEQLLIQIFKRAKDLLHNQNDLQGSPPLMHFLKGDFQPGIFTSDDLEFFAQLDDTDILAAVKLWQNHKDVVLSRLCNMLLTRRLLKIEIKNSPVSEMELDTYREKVSRLYGISLSEASYFAFKGNIYNQSYNQQQQKIRILRKTGKVLDITEASDHLNLVAQEETVEKYYICYPKECVT